MPLVIPGYAEAVARERFLRAASFVADREYICGVPVLPLSAWHVMALDTIGSPFVTQQAGVTADDVLNFLWIVSPKYRASALDRRWFWLTRVRKLDAPKAVQAIADYVREAYGDSPGGSGCGPSYYSAAAGLVDALASAYGWSEAELLRLPLKRAFQYAKAISTRLNPSAVMWNPSDRIKGDWLNSQAQN
jgi:hypothetical protein